MPTVAPWDQRADTAYKISGYFSVPSVCHLLLVDTTRMMILHFQRTGGGASNQLDTRIVTGGTLTLDPPGIDVDVTALYAKAELP